MAPRLALRLLALPCVFVAADVHVLGLTGPEKVANGHYEPQGENHGFPCYKNVDFKGADPIFLCIDAHGFWAVQPESEVKKQSANVYIHGSKLYTESPVGSGPWQIWDPTVKLSNGKVGGWRADSKVIVANVVTPGKSNMRRALAVSLWCILLSAGLVVMFLHSYDPRVRSMTYWLASSAITVVSAYLLLNVVHRLLFEHLLVDPFPRGLGLGYPVRPGVVILFWCILFTAGYASISIIGWKCQNSDKYLTANRTLTAALTAFIGIYAFSNILVLAISESWQQFLGPLLKTPEQAQMFVAVLTLGLVWFVLAIYRLAGVGLRGERLAAPPAFPWGQRRKGPAPPQAPAEQRSCMTYVGSTTPPARPVQLPEAPDWIADVIEGEDDATVIILGFLINQVLVFYNYGVLLPFPETADAVRTPAQMQFWWMTMVVFIVLSLLITVARSSIAAGAGRVGSLIQRTILSALVWNICQCMRAAILDNVLDQKPMAQFLTAFATLILSVVIIFIADKIFDSMANGKMAQTMNSLNPSKRGSRQQTKLTLTGTLGLLVGLAWAEVLLNAANWLIEVWIIPATLSWTKSETKPSGSDLTPKEEFALDVVIILLIVALFLRAWVVGILPKAMLTEQAVEEGIKFEVAQLNAMV